MSQIVAHEESAIVNVLGIILLMRNCAERSRALRIIGPSNSMMAC
jgi:hypothetical protein